jgi:hypothetical protein
MNTATSDHPRVVAVLETMWDWRNQTTSAGYRKEAPRHFQINPDNHSGRRLYKLVGGADLVVTNACRELVCSAREHGVPDPVWLAENLQRLAPIALLLVCGKVAQKTFAICGFIPSAPVIEIPHPAARGYWTKLSIAAAQQQIRAAIDNRNSKIENV